MGFCQSCSDRLERGPAGDTVTQSPRDRRRSQEGGSPRRNSKDAVGKRNSNREASPRQPGSARQQVAKGEKRASRLSAVKGHEGQYRASLQVKDGGFALKNFAATNTGKIEDYFTLDKQLGEGGFGTVKRGKDQRTGAVSAVKTIKKDAVPEVARLHEEIEIMRLLDHPNILRFRESFEDRKYLYLVLELCEGGELFDHIATSGCFTELIAAACVKQMTLALNYLHQNRIMHRDLKPENWLLGAKPKKRGSLELLKLIDFGLARRFQPGVPARTKAGTPNYIAPEVLTGRYDEKSDVWSLGVITYVMLSGSQPFVGKTQDDVLAQVKAAVVPMDSRAWTNISANAKGAVKNMLQKGPSGRPSCAQVLQLPWLDKVDANPVTSENDAVSALEVSGLKDFGRMHKMKRAALTVMASQLSDERIVGLRAMFQQMDANNDGTLSLVEIKAGLQKNGVACPPNLEKMLQEADTDGSGVVDYTEFLAATMDKKVYSQESAVWMAFKKFDLDDSGQIDKNELSKVLGDGGLIEAMRLNDEAKENLESIFNQVDVNGDGLIDFDEFFQMLRAAEQSGPGASFEGNGAGKSGGDKSIGIASSSPSES